MCDAAAVRGNAPRRQPVDWAVLLPTARTVRWLAVGAVVVAAGLVDALHDAQDITVYAPTNDAFDAIPVDIAGAILGDTGLLTAVLTYHVTPRIQDPRGFLPPVRRDTLLGQRVYYAYDDGAPRVNNAAVNCAGVRTSNGMVWLIDSVLLPGL